MVCRGQSHPIRACGEVLESHRTKTVQTQTVKSGFEEYPSVVGDITKAALLFEAMLDRDAAARSD
ncbi:hypothetical protein WN943_015767 [Citrus x changshan-huyou]